MLLAKVILIDGWSRKLQTILQNYIEKQVVQYKRFELQDYTYLSFLSLSKKPKAKPRRLRSIGGALRKILADNKSVNQVFYFPVKPHP